MKNIINENNLLKPSKVGEIIEGKIIGIGRSAIYLDIGIIGTGIIYGREFKEAKNLLKDLKIGDKLFAKIIELENEEGFFELSANQANKEITWEILKQKKEKGETFKVKILGANRGGLLTRVSNIPAFLPVSQLSLKNYPRVEGADQLKILKAIQKFIGKELEVKIFDISKKEEKLILSEKAKESEKTKELLKNYKIGDIIKGEVTGIVDFGVFMKFPVLPDERASQNENLEDIEGLVHISELNWELVENPSEVVKVGQKLRAKIINISEDKVFLSLKALKKDPWKDIEKKYKKGDIVKGKVTKFNPFGAFIQISSKIQGLCHISEFGNKTKMEDELKIGEKYDFKILFIIPKERKITLELVKPR